MRFKDHVKALADHCAEMSDCMKTAGEHCQGSDIFKASFATMSDSFLKMADHCAEVFKAADSGDLQKADLLPSGFRTTIPSDVPASKVRVTPVPRVGQPDINKASVPVDLQDLV